jgi:hypothetical protein
MMGSARAERDEFSYSFEPRAVEENGGRACGGTQTLESVRPAESHFAESHRQRRESPLAAQATCLCSFRLAATVQLEPL